MKILIVKLFVSCCLLFIFQENVPACVCAISGEEDKPEVFEKFINQSYENAEAVFTGKVIRRSLFEVYFEIDSVWKGDISEDFVLSTGNVDIGNGEFMMSSCDFGFYENKKYLVFAGKFDEPRSEKTKLLLARSCGGSDLLEEADRQINFLNKIKAPKNFKKSTDNQHL